MVEAVLVKNELTFFVDLTIVFINNIEVLGYGIDQKEKITNLDQIDFRINIRDYSKPKRGTISLALNHVKISRDSELGRKLLRLVTDDIVKLSKVKQKR